MTHKLSDEEPFDATAQRKSTLRDRIRIAAYDASESQLKAALRALTAAPTDVEGE